MGNFIMKMFSDSGEISSKRVCGTICILLLISEVVMAYLGHPIPDTYLYITAGLIMSFFGLTSIDLTHKINDAVDKFTEKKE